MIEEFRAGYESYKSNKNKKLIEAVRLAEIFEKELKDEQQKASKKVEEKQKTAVHAKESNVNVPVTISTPVVPVVPVLVPPPVIPNPPAVTKAISQKSEAQVISIAPEPPAF